MNREKESEYDEINCNDSARPTISWPNPDAFAKTVSRRDK